MKTIYSLLLFLFFTNFCIGQKNRIEKKIIKSIDQRESYYLDLLIKNVNINSGTMHFDGVKKVAQTLAPEFKAMGFEVELTEGKAYNRSGHLVATKLSSKGPKILLIGHLDTVFEKDSPFQKYQALNDTLATGPGIADMKGGNVILLAALNALHKNDLLQNMSVKVVLTGDEEKSGSPLALSKKELIEAAQWADIALGFENADGKPETIVVARRGSLSWKLTVKGTPAHSSQIFNDAVGSGAIFEASRILNTFYQTLSKEENLTFNPGYILGGTSVQSDSSILGGTAFGKTNVVAQRAIVEGDIRAISISQLNRVKDIMQTIVSQSYPKTQAILTFGNNAYPPLEQTSGNLELLKIYDKVSQDLGYGPVTAVNPRNAGAADISFTAGYVKQAVDGLGLSGNNDHTIHETGVISMLPVQAKRAAVLIYRLTL